MSELTGKQKEFFDRLASELEALFPKGERCDVCGVNIPCRSKALVFNAMVNVIAREVFGDTDSPMGVSAWKEYGKKYKYWKYFKQ